MFGLMDFRTPKGNVLQAAGSKWLLLRRKVWSHRKGHEASTLRNTELQGPKL